MTSESLSVRVEQEPDGRWRASGLDSTSSGATPAEALRLLADELERRQAAERFGRSMAALREQAQQSGLNLSEEDIEAEVLAARAERRGGA
jgi:hypothetical protein